MIKIINNQHKEGTLYEISVQCSIKNIVDDKEKIVEELRSTLKYIEAQLINRN